MMTKFYFHKIVHFLKYNFIRVIKVYEDEKKIIKLFVQRKKNFSKHKKIIINGIFFNIQTSIVVGEKCF